MIKLFVAIIFIFVSISTNAESLEKMLEKARKTYYSALENEDDLEPAVKQFEKISSISSDKKPAATTYIGSLTMLKGKYAFWPNDKLKYVNEGIKIMDKGYNLDKKNIESLFIYGSTCYYLPFFLGKKELAIQKLREMIPLLNKGSIKNYILYPLFLCLR
jgi:hypothetical protein